MSAFDYTRSKEVADRMIGRYGVAALLRVPGASTGPAYDPTPGAPTDHPCTAVVIDFTDYEITTSGGRIHASDKKVLLARGNLVIEPETSHKLVLGGEEHRIVGPDVGRGIKTVAPGGVTILWELQCRR